MDSSLIKHLSQSAESLLSISEAFESHLFPYYPNAMEGLALLKNLGSVTQQSLQSSLTKQPPQTPTTSSTNKNISAQKPANHKDAALIQALLELRNSKHLLKRPPGIYSPILRPKYP